MHANLRIIVVSSVTNPDTIAHIRSHRPDALISKTSGMDTVLASIESVSAGSFFCCPFIANIISRSHDAANVPFTAREMEMLRHFDTGLSIQETAEKRI